MRRKAEKPERAAHKLHLQKDNPLHQPDQKARHALAQPVDERQQPVRKQPEEPSLFLLSSGQGYAFFSMHATAWVEMPRPSPSKPSFSVVVALTFTQSMSTFRWRATFSRIVSM